MTFVAVVGHVVGCADLVVLDIASLAAAPQIATFFGDFGAEVIKVEPPDGDALRGLLDERGRALQWELVNRNKRCVTLDLSVAAGRAVFARMLDRADLLVSAMPAERLVAWGLDPAALRSRHPRLVAVNLTTFGTTGPWADRAGSGTLAEAATGLAHLTGTPNGPPTLAPVGLGDYVGVLEGIIAALLGLLERARGGAGAAYDVAMTDALLGLMAQRLAQVATSGVDPGRQGNRFPTMAPRNTYRTADGRWVAITAGTDAIVRRLFAAIGDAALADDVRFRTHRARLANVDALDQVIGAWMATRSGDEAIAALAGARVSAALVDDLAGVLRNPHYRARGVLAETHGITTTAPLPLRAIDPGCVRWLGRNLGADNDAVYGTWLGLSAGEREALRAAGVL